MGAVDTNVLVRLIWRDDLPQLRSAEAFIEGGIWVSVLVLAEAIRILKTVFERSAADLADAIEMLLKSKQVTLQDSDVVEAALELFRARPALGFSDCLTLSVARKAGHMPLGTFDRALSRVEGTQRL